MSGVELKLSSSLSQESKIEKAKVNNKDIIFDEHEPPCEDLP
jgi:hypothetical protein